LTVAESVEKVITFLLKTAPVREARGA